MSTTAGVFTETLIQTLFKRASEVAFDGRTKLQFTPQIDALKALQAIQGGQILSGIPGQKQGTVTLRWDNFCQIVADTNESCAMPTTKTSTNTKVYDLTYEKMAGFELDELDFDTNMASIAEHYAKACLTCEKVILEAFTQYCIAMLNTFKGCNLITDGLGTVSDLDTYIAAGLFNDAMIPYLTRVAIRNQMNAPIFLTGNNLWESFYRAKYNANDKTAENLYNQLRINFDLINPDTVNYPNYVSYLISNGSIALLNRAMNPSAVETSEIGQRWTANSILFPGFTFDVFKTTECDQNSSDRWITKIKYKLNADIVLNPTGCLDCNTGILTFVCGSVPEAI